MENRREFIKKVSAGVAAVAVGGSGFNLSAKSYTRIIHANDKIRVGIVGFSDRFRSSLFPSFMNHARELNFELVALSDIRNRRREEGKAYIREKQDGMLPYVVTTRSCMSGTTSMQSSSVPPISNMRCIW